MKIGMICLFLSSATCGEPDSDTILKYNLQIPKDTQLRERVLTTVVCDDCKEIPKCPHAGQLVKNGTNVYQLMHNGIQIIPDCYYGNWMTLLIQLSEGHHEPQEEKAFYEVLRFLPPKAVMIELGSYWGYYSMWFAKSVPEAQNYLIEPDEKNLEIGQKHFSINGLTADFTHAMVGNQSYESREFKNWDYETMLVPQICMDDFAKNKNIPFIHLLHSDIQGAEVEMLEGCKQLIADQKIGYLFISTHRGTHEKCLDALKNTSYQIILSVTREESYSADGLIVAKSPKVEGPSFLNTSKRTEQIKNLIHQAAN